jgi:hypothetical protein
MTPHHPNYYSGGPSAPTDFDDPTPIPFVSVKGTFHLAVSCDDPGGAGWAKLALDLLCEALQHWGAGGKTSSGYGRLAPDRAECTLGAGQRTTMAVEIAEPTRLVLRAEDDCIAVVSGDRPHLVVGQVVDVTIISARRDRYVVALRPPSTAPGEANDDRD